MSNGAVVAAIPARYASSRLPGKPLRSLAGKPLIEHVWKRVSGAEGLDRVVVLTDDERVARTVRDFGGEVEMTPASCDSGTARVAWAAREWTCEVVVNVQGDEPLVDPGSISTLARHLLEHPGSGIATLASRGPAEAGRDDPNLVKVVRRRDGSALYFSRAPIPWPRDEGEAPRLHHVGIYGYRHTTLLEIAALDPTPLEQTERLEQLRWLEHGHRIDVLLSDEASHAGIDTEEDLRRLEIELQGE